LSLQGIFASDETDDWIGKKVQLYVDQSVTFAGRLTPAIRIRAVDEAPPTRPARMANASPPPAEREPGLESEPTPF
jgi:hypothetical protein